MLKPLLAWCLGLSIVIASTPAVAESTIILKPQQMEAGERLRARTRLAHQQEGDVLKPQRRHVQIFHIPTSFNP